jgi:prepilin-type N-terminal cleavage/methylation domain-containing protein
MGHKSNSNRGFTLVELIVVLVILAVLAAILVPTLIGYIDKAKTANVIQETQQVKIAAQAQYLDAYGKGSFTINPNGSIKFIPSKLSYNQFTSNIKNLSEIPSDTTCFIEYKTDTKGTINTIILFDGKKGCIYYDNHYYTDNDTVPIYDSVPTKKENLDDYLNGIQENSKNGNGSTIDVGF